MVTLFPPHSLLRYAFRILSLSSFSALIILAVDTDANALDTASRMPVAIPSFEQPIRTSNAVPSLAVQSIFEAIAVVPTNSTALPTIVSTPGRDYSVLLPNEQGNHADCIANYYACLIGNASDSKRDERLKEYEELYASLQKIQEEIASLQEQVNDAFSVWQNGIQRQNELLADPLFEDPDWVDDYNRHVQITTNLGAKYIRLAGELAAKIKASDLISKRLATFQSHLDWTHNDRSGGCTETLQTCEYEEDLRAAAGLADPE